jgi:hypothetical protein
LQRAEREHKSEAVRGEYSERQEAKLKDKGITSPERCSFPIPDIDLDAGTVHSLFTKFYLS